MFDIDDDVNEVMGWVADNITEMSFNDQMKLFEAYMSVMNVTKELYEKYNKPKPKPNRYFFMP
jgi:hypothetical protein